MLIMLHLECCVQFWAHWCKGDMNALEKVQCRDTKLMKAQEHPTYEQSQRELGLFRLETRRVGGDLINVYKCLKGGCKEDRDKLFLVVPSDRQEAMGTT